MKLLNRPKRTTPKTAVEFEAQIADLQERLAGADARLQEIEESRGRIYLSGSDDELAAIQTDAVTIAEQKRTIESALDIANREHHDALRREHIAEVEKRMAAARALRTEQLADYVKVHEMCSELARVLGACKKRQEAIDRDNNYARNAGCGNLAVDNLCSALATVTGRTVAIPERTIKIPEYWPAPMSDHPQTWAGFEGFDAPGYKEKAAKIAERRKADKDELHRIRRETEIAKAIADRSDEAAKKANAQRLANKRTKDA